MGFFFEDKFQVIEKGGLLSSDKVALDNVSEKEAQKFIDKRSGLFGDGKTYYIKKK
ncbi:hypothetical protein WOSG25_050190 [Weissella oryzae SG25]|uniref:Uncharacterized protein n=1 Tax=Weissella oryzae (strain DSM 25784 / JCM 18191 / LMG 30913 / SG25) TaxID=1329250 RepID=A0A069CTM5_WEIOS|nr:hypothetical protein [Weissella oryzae]GAK30747.1 hypothetical protein WOSG25_050190 [Weissella oryzae SG25]